MPALREHYAHCQAEVRAHAKDRFLAALYAPAEVRPHLYALIAFDLEIGRVGERVREPMAGEVRLQWWRDALAGRGSEASGHPVAAALIDTIERRSLDRDSLLKLVDAHSFDLYDDPMPTLQALAAYADATAGALFHLAARILGEDGPVISEAALLAGRAETYVWVLRNAAHHAARGKIYLPRELLERYAVNLINWSDRAFRQAVVEVTALAAADYAAARDLLGDRPERSVALLPLALVPLHLARLARAGYDPSQGAAEMPQWRSQWALWRAARRGL